MSGWVSYIKPCHHVSRQNGEQDQRQTSPLGNTDIVGGRLPDIGVLLAKGLSSYRRGGVTPVSDICFGLRVARRLEVKHSLTQACCEPVVREFYDQIHFFLPACKPAGSWGTVC